MSEKLGFCELLEPHFALSLADQSADCALLRELRDTSTPLDHALSGTSATVSQFAVGLLDYLLIEELHSTTDDTAVAGAP